MDLFFVLSGFLISGLLFREHGKHGSIHFGRFFTRRGLKIYPTFYVFLFSALTLEYWLRGNFPETIWPELVFLQNYFPAVFGHTWSLAVEEHFYVFLPLLLVLLLRLRTASENPFSWIPGICLACSVVGLTLRFQNEGSYAATHLRMDALMFGVCLSYWHHFHRDQFVVFCRRWFGLLLFCGVLLTLPAFTLNLGKTDLMPSGLTQIYVGCGMVVSAIVARGVPVNRLTRAVAFCGVHSYAIYLWHIPMRRWTTPMTEYFFGSDAHNGTKLAVYLVSSVVVGIVSTRIVEIPSLRFRDRFFPSRSASMIENGRERERETGRTEPEVSRQLPSGSGSPVNAGAEL